MLGQATFVKLRDLADPIITLPCHSLSVRIEHIKGTANIIVLTASQGRQS